ncbi:MAG TPA: hypothetical protein VGD69_00105 [Herpetosiphonaceae bacterium]
MRRIVYQLQAMLALALVFAALPLSVAEAQARVCFPETNQCLEGRFREYWTQNGGLPVFGYPVTQMAEEYNFDLEQSFMTQWFERGRFELHPENPRPYDVLLGRLGADVLRKMNIDWQTEPKGTQQPDCLWFAETQHGVCDQASGIGFKTYWQTHGLEFDGQRGVSYAESLALFGLPLTEPRMETNSSGDRVLTQWFERGRFEWHPNQPDQYKVLLGLLGNEARVPFVRYNNPGLPGRLLVLADRLYSLRADGSRVTPLPVMNSGFVSSAFSPDGRRMATRCTSGGADGLCIISLDTGAITRLNNDSSAVAASWSPDGTRIAYESGSNDRRGLHVINADGSGDILLMAGLPERMPTGGSWSPDGRQLTFATIYSENAIYVVNSDGTGLRQIVAEGRSPTWSPDGSRIAFDSISSGNWDVYTVRPDGSGLTALTTSPDAEQGPVWSPDGSRLAYTSSRYAPGPGNVVQMDVYLVRADGGNGIKVLSHEGTNFIGGLAWSPDGSYIAAGLTLCPRLGCGPSVIGATSDGSRSFTILRGENARGGASLVDWLPE